MSIKPKTIINYILIYILFIFQGSVFFKNNQDLFYLGIYAGFAVLLIKNQLKLLDKKFFLLLILLFFSLLITFINTSGGFSISSIGNIISRYLLVYMVYQYNSEKFCDRYVLFINFMSLLSLAFYLIQIVDIDILKTILLPCENSEVTYYGQFLFCIAPVHLTKNVGVFTEPGLYQITLNASLFILLFLENRLSLTRKQRHLSILIVIITIITTQSTTGYISTIILVLFYLAQNKRNEQRKYKIYFVFIIFTFIIVDLSRGNNGFIYESITKKLFDSTGHFNITVDTGASRYYSMLADLSIARLYPLGCGYTKYLSIWRSYLIGNIRDESSTTGLTASLATAGIPSTFLSMVIICYLLRKNYSDIFTKMAYILMFVNVSLSQPNIRFPALMILLFLSSKKSKKSGLKLYK